MQSPFPRSSTRQNSPLDELKPQSSEGLGQRLADGAQAALDRVAEKSTPAVDKIADSAKAVVDATIGKLERVPGDSLDSVRTYVRDRPFTALAAAALLGALLGGLLSNSRYRG